MQICTLTHMHTHKYTCTLSVCQEKKEQILAYTIWLKLITSKLQGPILAVQNLFLCYTRWPEAGSSNVINTSIENPSQELKGLLPLLRMFHIIDLQHMVKKALDFFCLIRSEGLHDFLEVSISWCIIMYKPRTCARNGHAYTQFTFVLFYKLTFLLLIF